MWINTTLVVGLLATSIQTILAHSAAPRPLKRAAHPSTIVLEILPRHDLDLTKRSLGVSLKSPILRYDDSIRLIMSAFQTTFHLHLRPNEHLVHPAARVHYYTTDADGKGSRTETKPLRRETVRAYEGYVIHPSETHQRLREDAASVPPRHRSHPSVLGWARIVVHHQGSAKDGIAPVFEGAFSVNGRIHHVVTMANWLRNKHELDPKVIASDVSVEEIDGNLVVWRDEDVMSPQEEEALRAGKSLDEIIASSPPEKQIQPQTCGHDRLLYNTPSQNPLLQPKPAGPPGTASSSEWYDGLYARDDISGGGSDTNFADSIGSHAGCPTSQKIVYMGVAADCKFVQQYGSKDNATTQILTDWNSASSLYKETFNISLGIVELAVQDPVCPTTAPADTPWNVDCNTTLNDRLSIFSQWRGDKGNDNAGLWHLMSGCPTGTEVGIAWLGTICQQTASGQSPSVVSGTAVSTSGRTEWQVIAHEIGHNFGAIHDCADGCNSTTSCCPLTTTTCDANAQFIMSPVAQAGEKTFSQCSVGNICSVIGGSHSATTNATCLVSPDSAQKTITLQMCGNGIVESGEDCDPGVGVTSNCCDSTTCKFKNNAKCDPLSSPCCTDSCTFANTTVVCRPSKDPKCDQAEFCTGTSSACPADIVSPNGQSCGSGGLACASGQCTSVATQCQTVGSSMGLTNACPNRGDQTCQISCQDPTNSNQCVLLSTMLIDGSPCGYGGMCVGGKCQAGSILDTAKAWYVQNLQIAIPVTIVAGLFVLMILYCLIRSLVNCCRGGRRGPTVTLAQLRHERLGSYDPRNGPMPTFRGSPAVPNLSRPQQAHGYSRSRSNWVDETKFNGPRGG